MAAERFQLTFLPRSGSSVMTFAPQSTPRQVTENGHPWDTCLVAPRDRGRPMRLQGHRSHSRGVSLIWRRGPPALTSATTSPSGIPGEPPSRAAPGPPARKEGLGGHRERGRGLQPRARRTPWQQSDFSESRALRRRRIRWATLIGLRPRPSSVPLASAAFAPRIGPASAPAPPLKPHTRRRRSQRQVAPRQGSVGTRAADAERGRQVGRSAGGRCVPRACLPGRSWIAAPHLLATVVQTELAAGYYCLPVPKD
jgi:hypothetical protein